MKKSLIALAALAAAGVASAQTATAQNPGASAVTIFGVVDVSVTRVDVDNGPSRTTMEGSGRNASSRLGFRGMEDLGGGLAAAFWLEAGINPDNGSGQATGVNNTALSTGAAVGAGAGAAFSGAALGGNQGLTFNRASTISLLGRGFGEVRLGRDYATTFWNQTSFDPFGTVGVGAATNTQLLLTGTADPAVRTSNAVSWLSPNWGGFRAQVQYALSEQPSNCGSTVALSTSSPAAGCFGRDGDGRAIGTRLSYANGPIAAAFAYQRVTYGSTAFTSPAGVTTRTGDWNLWNIAGSYDFGVARVMAQYGNQTNDATVAGARDAEAKTWMLGAVAPMGPWQLKASYGQAKRDDISGRKVDQLAFGAQYDLSKRTALYGTYSRLKADAGSAALAFTGLGTSAAVAAGASSKATGLDLGVRHSF